VNLKQKTVLFVAVSIVALLGVYIGFSTYYVRTQERVLIAERTGLAQAIAQEFTDFFQRGVDRLQMVASLPALVYGLETLEEKREGKQISAWTTLHYLFYESDVFTGVYLVSESGKILWSEPPDHELIDTPFESFEDVRELGDVQTEVGFVLSESQSGLDLLIVAPVMDREGRKIASLIGVIPNAHASIQAILSRIGKEHGSAQLVEEQRKFVIASTEKNRELGSLQFPDPSRHLTVSERAAPTPWLVILDQNAEEAYAGVNSLKSLLTVFGAVFIFIAMGSLIFMLRSFTRPVEELTSAARRIADGDLTGVSRSTAAMKSECLARRWTI
jgi:hypothetical protein